MPLKTDGRLDSALAALRFRGPMLVNVLLIGLIALEVGRSVVLITRDHPGSTPPAAAAPVRQPSGRSIDVSRILSAHLFGQSADDAPQNPDDAAPSLANLELEGTIATSDPKRGYAIIRKDGPATVYRVGELIDAMKVHSVYRDHVLLNRGGNLESLILRHSSSSLAAWVPTPSGVSAPRTAVIVDNLGRVVDKPPSVLSRMIRTVGKFDSTREKFQGFTVYPIGNGAVLRAMGLSPGDVIKSINGSALDDVKRGRELLDKIGDAEQVAVTIERQGLTLSATLDVGEASRVAKEPAIVRQPKEEYGTPN